MQPNDCTCSAEPTTLVVFTLRELRPGTELSVTESGFDQISPVRRARVTETKDTGGRNNCGAFEGYVDQAL